MKLPTDHIYVILAAFLSALGCFTAVAVIGSDGFEVLRDVMLTLAGALGGVAVTRVIQPPPE